MCERRPIYKLLRNVFLVGFMGAGKSTLARKLARRYGITSLDLDMYIERKQKKSIAAIFEERGEKGFREIEAKTLRELAGSDDAKLISCGGGVVVTEGNKRILKDCGFTIHLMVDADVASSRIADKSSRPLFADMEQARRRAKDRMPLYREVAHAELETNGKNPNSLVREVADLLLREGILDSA